MANDLIPYLCGGTFLTQVLRARPTLVTSTEHTKGQKENLSEQETFRRLISIYQMKDFPSCSSLKPYTNYFKSCADSLEAFTLFSDNDMKRAFDEDVRSSDSSALAMISEFIQEFIDPVKYIQLIRCLLDMLQSDSTIAPSTLFYISGNAVPVTKAELDEMDAFVIEPFLLGIWHFIIMNRSGCNKNGAATYQQWYREQGKYMGTIGNNITRQISVKSVPQQKKETIDADCSAEENSQTESDDPSYGNSESTRMVNQYIDHATIVNQYGEKSVHIDHVGTLNL